MTFTFQADARAEFIAAVAYYESCREGLGLRFSREIHTTIDRIRLRPTAWPEISENTRRCFTRRFPYGVIYEVRDRDTLIIAITHLNREPGHWLHRGR